MLYEEDSNESKSDISDESDWSWYDYEDDDIMFVLTSVSPYNYTIFKLRYLYLWIYLLE